MVTEDFIESEEGDRKREQIHDLYLSNWRKKEKKNKKIRALFFEEKTNNFVAPCHFDYLQVEITLMQQ